MATLIVSDLEFILQQILVAEAHANGAELTDLLPNSLVPMGLRTVDGSYNNLVPGQQFFGAADQLFPRMLPPEFRDGDTVGSYGSDGMVVDSQPRTISNLIVDQTVNNPSALEAAIAQAGLTASQASVATADIEGGQRSQEHRPDDEYVDCAVHGGAYTGRDRHTGAARAARQRAGGCYGSGSRCDSRRRAADGEPGS